MIEFLYRYDKWLRSTTGIVWSGVRYLGVVIVIAFRWFVFFLLRKGLHSISISDQVLAFKGQPLQLFIQGNGIVYYKVESFIGYKSKTVLVSKHDNPRHIAIKLVGYNDSKLCFHQIKYQDPSLVQRNFEVIHSFESLLLKLNKLEPSDMRFRFSSIPSDIKLKVQTSIKPNIPSLIKRKINMTLNTNLYHQLYENIKTQKA